MRSVKTLLLFLKRHVSILISFMFFVLFSSPGFGQNAALVIIDMQPHFTERNGRYVVPENQRKFEQVLQRQTELIALAKIKGIPILLIEYDGCGSTCKTITDEIGDYRNKRIFVKETNGLFDKWNGVLKQVQKFLDENKVTELIMTGANGGECAKCTLEGAVKKGYGVWTDQDAIIDFNENDFVYPYHYEQGTLRLNVEEANRINQLKHITDIDGILEVAKTKLDNKTNGNGLHILPEIQSRVTQAIQKCIKNNLKSLLSAP